MKDRAPKRLWVIIDDDPAPYGGVMAWEETKKAADEECRRYNKIPGYAPTCRVVEYVAKEAGARRT